MPPDHRPDLLDRKAIRTRHSFGLRFRVGGLDVRIDAGHDAVTASAGTPAGGLRIGVLLRFCDP